MRCTLQLVNEAIHCLGEGILRSPRDGDIGAIFGLGFPPFRGGPFRYVDSIGAAEALRRIEGYQQRFGRRWAPAPELVEMAKTERALLSLTAGSQRAPAALSSSRWARRSSPARSRSDTPRPPKQVMASSHSSDASHASSQGPSGSSQFAGPQVVGYASPPKQVMASPHVSDMSQPISQGPSGSSQFAGPHPVGYACPSMQVTTCVQTRSGLQSVSQGPIGSSQFAGPHVVG